MTPPARILVLFVLLLLLGTVALAAGANANAAVALDVPFVAQDANACGAASVAMVMRYWMAQGAAGSSTAADLSVIRRAVVSRQAHGAFASSLERYLSAHGFRTFSFSGKWNDLRDHLAKGRPLIVALRPAGAGSRLHYVVVAGVDDAAQDVLLNDPARRKLARGHRREFEKQWSATANWTLLAVPRQDAQ